MDVTMLSVMRKGGAPRLDSTVMIDEMSWHFRFTSSPSKVRFRFGSGR